MKQAISRPIGFVFRRTSCHREVLEETARGVCGRGNDVPLKSGPLRTGDSKARRRVGVYVVNLFCVVQQARHKRPAQRHADRQKRQTGKADEAQRGQRVL